MITLQNVSVVYRSGREEYQALAHVNLELPAGKTCAIIGPSGCGKSTLLKVLAGIITEYEGLVELDGKPIRPECQKIGFIPQNYGLMPWKTVAGNIRLGVKIKYGHLPGEQETLEQLLAQLGLLGLENRYPGELSGGQQQRVSLARSFLLQPDVLLMDEPFSALDAMTREDIQNVFLRVWKQNAVSTVLVTHHVEEAVYLGQKIIILSGCPGTVGKVIDNPLFGLAEVRNQPEFFHMCLSLRKMIKEDWSA